MEVKDKTKLVMAEYNLDPVTLSAAGAIAQKVPAIADVLSKVNSVADKAVSAVGLGGVSQDRFIDRTLEADKYFDNAGYSGKTEPGALFTKYKLRKTQVTDKKTKGNYQPEFDRLHAYIVERMNIYNPGMGTAWAQWYPKLQLANLGNISSKNPAWLGFQELVKTYKPGTFNPAAMLTAPMSTISDVKEMPDVKITNVEQPNAPIGNVIAGGFEMSTTTIVLAVIVLIALLFIFK